MQKTESLNAATGLVVPPLSPHTADESPFSEDSSDATTAMMNDPAADKFSSAECRRKIARIERDMELDEVRLIEEQKEMQRVAAEEQEALAALARKPQTDFEEQSSFKWSIPKGAASYRLPTHLDETGCRVRPAVPAAYHKRIPQAPSASLPFAAQEAAYAERLAALRTDLDHVRSLRHASEFDLEDAMFTVESSDDSEGYDEDYALEWRPQTYDIASACRACECNVTDEEAASNFASILNDVADVELTAIERALIWDTLRYCYRRSQPIHHKHWLGDCHSIIATGGFPDHLSIANWNHIVTAATKVSGLTDRQRAKLQRWAMRVTSLIAKRISILREFGFDEPSWKDVNVSCGGLSRNCKVPTMPIDEMMASLTALSIQHEATSESPVPSEWRRSGRAQSPTHHQNDEQKILF